MKTLRAGNAKILNVIRNNAGLAYRNRVPEASTANMQEVAAAITSFTPTRNEFLDNLINRIGLTVAREMSWNNPLKQFKRGMLNYGDTIQEIYTGLVHAHTYNAKRDYLERDIFGQYIPDIEAAYHSITRQEYYPITVNNDILRRAFTQEDGLSNLVNQILQAPLTSDEYDEYLQMTKLFSIYENEHGFHKVKVADPATANTEQTKGTLKALRMLSYDMAFPSAKYNPLHMPVVAKPEDMVLFATPAFITNIDVDALAPIFHIDRADHPYRVIPIRPEDLGIDKAVGVLCHKDFFVVADTLLENRSISNPVGLYDNYFMHHHSIISASYFVPAVLLTTGDATPVEVIPTVENTLKTSIVISDNDGKVTQNVSAGETYSIGSPAPAGVAVDWVLKSGDATIDNEGVITIGARAKPGPIVITATIHAKPDVTKDYSITVA